MMQPKVLLLDKLRESGMTPMPVKIHISLAPLIRDLAADRPTGVQGVDAYNRALALQGLSQPDLATGPLSDALMERHRDLIVSLLSVYFSPSYGDEMMFAVISPFSDVGFYASQKFAEIFLDGSYKFIGMHVDRDEVEGSLILRSLLAFILTKGYGQHVDDVASQEVFSIEDPKSGLTRFYQFDMDHKFCDVEISPDAPTVDQKTLQDILAHISDPMYGLRRLPLDSIKVMGVGLVRAFDVTSQVVIGQLKQKVLSAKIDGQNEFLSDAQNIMRIICRDQEARIAIWLPREGSWMRQTTANIVDFFHGSAADRIGADKIQGTAFARCCLDNSMVIECLNSKSGETELDSFFKSRGDATLIVVPLLNGDDQIGFLELTTPRKRHSHGYDLPLLREAANLFSIAVQRASDSYLARMDAVIKSNCTAIHPAVEWKFKSAAMDAIREGSFGVMAPVVFDHVYPLYGVCDIRGSSAQRSKAIQSDLHHNLNLLRNLFSSALTYGDMPSLRFLLFRIEGVMSSLTSSMVAGLELDILRVINDELHPSLSMIASINPTMFKAVAEYKKLVDNDHQSIYVDRKAFDSSVELLSRELAAWLDRKQIVAQNVVPHYFEKHLTDGVDHSIYVGQSIDKTGRYSHIALKSLRLWQLETLCELAHIAHKMKQKTPVSLETCQMIVAQDAPLTVGFRYDERKFDVHGAYNIRYELMKKRLDKAVIKGTGERLTQPGTVAIVFSQESERDEYIGYGSYLASLGVVESAVSTFVLDDLQDVSGLRAMRLRLDNAYIASDVSDVAYHGKSKIAA
jgi:hypothetical protein